MDWGTPQSATLPTLRLSRKHDESLVGVLTDFLSTVPTQLSTALVALAPYVSRLRYLVQALTWSGSWLDSWILLASWWAICLFVVPVLQYFVPAMCLLWLPIVGRQRHRMREQKIVTEQTLQAVISDLTTLHSLLPSAHSFPTVPTSCILRLVTAFYLPYLLLTYILSLQVLVAVVGTIFLTWCAPWAIVLRAALWRSAWFRWSVFYLNNWITGHFLSPEIPPHQPDEAFAKPVNSTRYLFSIYENQRWWVGLDWTAALLPGERPSWCTTSQMPISPPNAFTLPDNTTVYLPGGRGKRIRRTATWRWEEQEWQVVVRREGGSLNRVERPIMTITEETSNSSLLLGDADRSREGCPDTPQEKAKSTMLTPDTADCTVEESDDSSGEDPITDADGWVYGDNKWECRSSRGGMGKYTRYRKWTRVAMVSEIIEVVGDGDIGVLRQPAVVVTGPEHHWIPSPDCTASNVPSSILSTSIGSADSPLRQRLKAALSKNSPNS